MQTYCARRCWHSTCRLCWKEIVGWDSPEGMRCRLVLYGLCGQIKNTSCKGTIHKGTPRYRATTTAWCITTLLKQIWGRFCFTADHLQVKCKPVWSCLQRSIWVDFFCSKSLHVKLRDSADAKEPNLSSFDTSVTKKIYDAL